MGKINYELWSSKGEEEKEFCLGWNSLLCLLNISIYGEFFALLLQLLSSTIKSMEK